MTPVKQTAAVILETGHWVELRQVDVPKPGENEVLIKVNVAALNPIDWKMAEWAAPPGSIQQGKVIGTDVAGIVEELGSGAEKLRKVGERVAALIFGGASIRTGTQPTNGGYAQYVVAKADICLQIPAEVSDEDAAQLPLAVFTACQTLYQSLKLPAPPKIVSEQTPILIYGASSAVGIFNVQFAKFSGFKVYATSSPKNFPLLKRIGADEVFDYNDADASKKIKELTSGKLLYAVDAISGHGSAEFIADAVADTGVRVAIVLEIQPTREGITFIHSLAYDLLTDRAQNGGKSYIAGGPGYANIANSLLAAGKIQFAPTRVAKGGLSSANEEWKNMKAGGVSGQKIVFRIAETPGLA
ncbi:oxidoreductase [Vararia minispora EC-137]|uniref:Oxidoreductase n=1 Tax=Vararia minispora EC-137 TaxID=1314806 RepID=A0ACB8QNJ2_9AGAM|nr:oxidoreductase [Vararia minispora EC-137]